MDERFSRTRLLFGAGKMERLQKSKVIIFGKGGVGGYVTEALARSGIGHLALVDNDKVSLSNINRQIIALDTSIGRYKVDVMAERIHDINPDARVEVYKCFYLPETSSAIDLKGCSYVVDAVDTVTAKLEIIKRAKEAGVPVISSMGTGNKYDPAQLKLADIYDTRMCPLAKVMRHECRRRGITDLKVVYSGEEPMRHTADVPGSTAFVPPAAGLMIASEIVKDLTEDI